ncbi:MAG: alpha-ketoglutarate-dependent dioxygenase AlkB [Sediminimonas sp.]|uniref:alpha-ketoglutarate-dependent dioxygenase AlkB n=1 Tax=Sediminimonas sp. TaxID=2823379 RepID=UPI0028709D72|nr:alpha-ketoglutarate-dependent dioxygenase AlkB [Sediminimonas sp.]MDR9486208.1 alpha-ketoglutarate-dependent dioxygenase AlkB [Sediminimonas sp.]
MTTAPSQLSLFPADPSPELPDGLTYREDYITGSDADGLLAAVDASAWLADLKRRVQHYGYRYDYKARQARREDRIGPLPTFLERLAIRLAREGVFSKPPDQVIVNEYLSGQGISAHIDCRPCFGDTIAILSLGSACVMRFAHRPSSRTVDLALRPLGLLSISGEARNEWTHAIPARQSDAIDGEKHLRSRRVSLTFRTMRFE